LGTEREPNRCPIDCYQRNSIEPADYSAASRPPNAEVDLGGTAWPPQGTEVDRGGTGLALRLAGIAFPPRRTCSVAECGGQVLVCRRFSTRACCRLERGGHCQRMHPCRPIRCPGCRTAPHAPSSDGGSTTPVPTEGRRGDPGCGQASELSMVPLGPRSRKERRSPPLMEEPCPG
jgi:hypothetical protein